MRRFALFLAIVWLGLAMPASAADLDDGLAAFHQQAYETAYRLLLPLAEAGNAEAQFLVGWMLQTASGVTADRAAGSRWNERAAAQGHALAALQTGQMYYHGDTVPRSDSAAAAWYERAGDLGETIGYIRAAEIYEEIVSEWSNPAEIDRLYAKALQRYTEDAAAGDANAQGGLARMLVWALGTPQDFPRASRLMHAAANAGDAAAQIILGVWYDASQRTTADDHKRNPLLPPISLLKPDIAEAYKWYELAARGGSHEGAGRRNFIIQNMTLSQVRDGLERADSWRRIAPVPMR